MKKAGQEFARLSQLVLVAGALSTWHMRSGAQEAPPPQPPATGPQSVSAQGSPEEVVVIGRSLRASENLVKERLEDPSVVDTIGAEAIARLGDTTVAASLRRIPGLSLVSDKFVYIRGLGERYSATALNGTDIPSPDLTRNVIPLDIFPTSVVESVRVQKAWSPDLPANFGGGSVNIRTRGIAQEFELNFELSSGTNTESSGKALTYPGGSEDERGSDDGTRRLSPAITAAIQQYQGDTGVQSILTFLQRAGDGSATLADAQAVNRSLGLELNRNIGIEEQSISPDLGVKASIGDRLQMGEHWEVGMLAGVTYDNSWRESVRRARNFSFPEERTDTETQSTHSVNMSGTGNLGLKLISEHAISATTVFVRNTDDETAVRDFFNENRQVSDGLGFRGYRLQFEERNLLTHQVEGEHRFGERSREMFPNLAELIAWAPPDSTVTWFYSRSKATTDIPNHVNVTSMTVTDPLTGAVLSEALALQSTAADYRYTDLEDRVRDYGWALSLPFRIGESRLEFKGGTRHSQKARAYRQSQFSLGPLAVADPSILTGPLDEVLSDANIVDPANNFVFARQGTNNQSYIAATMTDAVFGIADWSYDERWRLAAGARWEDYRQAAVDWNPYGFSQAQPQVPTDADVLQRGTFQSDDVYPAASLTYTGSWLAETFQVRLGWSRTVIRPDLRELTDASYIDPITQILTRGNSGVVPADVTNYDLRAEWRFAGGDSLTLTFFDKQLDHPIEFFESAASDTTIAREILNAESAQVRGVELEGLKQLDFLGRYAAGLFLQGNLTVQDSQLVAGPRADAPTQPVRGMAGASEYVLNLMLGFDSSDGKHTASLIYNMFGERLYVAGRNGAPDGFEQPFHGLDITYSWYPTDSLTLKAKVQNILGDSIEIERGGLVTFEQDPGSTFALSASWAF